MAHLILSFQPISTHSSISKTKNLHYRISHSNQKIITISQRRNSIFIARATEPSSGSDLAPPKTINGDKKSSGAATPTENLSGFGFPWPSIPPWATWLFGAAAFLSVPLYRRIQKVEEVIEKVEKTAESAAEVIDKVAEETEKIAADVANAFPENSNIKEVAMKIEAVAHRIENDAEKVEEVLKKIEDVTEEVEKLVEPVIERGEAKEKGVQVNTNTHIDDSNST